MNTNTARILLALGLWILAGIASAQQVLPSLFSTMTPAAPDRVAQMRDRQAVRARPVHIDLSLLTAPMTDVDKVPAPQQAIALNLFDDVQYVADLERVERTATGMAWIGRLRDVGQSQVIMVVSGTIVSGNIVSPQGRYHIRFAGDSVHEVQAIDTSLFGADEPFVPIPGPMQSALPAPDLSAGMQPDDGSMIDVMVVYTATARAAAGSTGAMQSLIDLAITETNQSYQNSNINQRVRLVHSVEVAYTEPTTDPLGTGLNCITATADGCLDNVHTLRDTYGADLVSFWLEDGGGYCGLAWLMTNVSGSFASNGFSTVARSCATGYYSFGHELGHNMGARHDTYVDSGTTPYTYAHGYTDPNASSPWRTVMAYNNACADVGKSCTRIPYWSNPSLYYGGRVTGNSTADNHSTLDNTAYTVANFRSSSTSTVQFSTTAVTVAEGSNATLTITRAGSTAGAASVSFATASGTAASGLDFTATSGTVSWAAGDASSRAITVPITNDSAAEAAEAFTVTLSSPVGATLGSQSSATVTISASDLPSFPANGVLPVGWVQAPGSATSWAVASDYAFEGSYSLKSVNPGTPPSGRSASAIQVSGRYKAGTISFALWVDSESGYDFLRFYIDGNLQGEWSGQLTNWYHVSFPVASGSHTFKWEYSKDYSVSTGADAAWIDAVQLPPRMGSDITPLLMLLLN